MPPLSLAHFTVVEADPITLIEAAQAGRYDAIGLRIVPPFLTDHVFPVIGDPNLIRSIKRRLMETGIRVLDVEAIWLTAQSDVATLEPALDIAVELGAGYVIVVGNDPDRGRLARNFSRLCAAANLRKVRVMLEFIPYSHIRALAQAVALLADVEPTNAGVLVDALHLSRSGGSPADLAQYDPALFSYMHLCDAPATPRDPMGCVPKREKGGSIPEKAGFGSLISLEHFPGTHRSPSRLRAPVGLDCHPPNAQAWLRPGQGSCSGS